MDELAARPAESLSVQDRNQLIAHRSNANFLASRAREVRAESEARRQANPHGREVRRVDRDLTSLRALAGEENEGGIFTRDIDSGELMGLTKSRALLSVNTRQLDRIGRVRKMADFNRGGGAGIYTRYVSPGRLDAGGDLAPLGIGSIGNAGITIALDAASVVRDVQHPLEVFHNNADSAGRIFGRTDPETGRKVGRGSERFLGRMNPTYWRRDENSPDPLDFNVRPVARAAVIGHRQLRDIAENPSEHTDHNEQIWMVAPSLEHTTGVFVQTQQDRPPVLRRKTAEEIRAERERRQRALDALDQQERELATRRRGGELTHPEFVTERAKLLTRRRRLEGPLYADRVDATGAARLPRELRLPEFWENGAPRGWEALDQLHGANGVAFSSLVTHVRPSYARAAMPHDIRDPAFQEQVARREAARRRREEVTRQLYRTTESAPGPTLIINGRSIPVDLPGGR